jgi:hypothetical protein
MSRDYDEDYTLTVLNGIRRELAEANRLKRIEVQVALWHASTAAAETTEGDQVVGDVLDAFHAALKDWGRGS